MTRLAQTERQALCDTALQLGEDQPTLCGDWTVKDLVVHLLVREGSPAAAGILVKPLARLTDLESRRYARRDFTVLVERLRSGPPVWSPYGLPRMDAVLNTLEYLVHHEDIRRAQPTWAARSLPEQAEKLVWRQIRVAAKGLTRNAPVGVRLASSVSGSEAVVRPSDGAEVTVRGLPSEVALFVYGRTAVADVELLGEPDAVAALRGASLGA